MTTREGRRFAVASPHRLASEAAASVAEAGGNAVDAAVAANLVLTVVYPHMCSVGGDVMALVCTPGDEVVAVDGSGAWPRALNDRTGEPGWRMPVVGPGTVTVPGAVHAWGTMLDRWGSRTLGELMSYAVAPARDGVPVASSLAGALAGLAAGGDTGAFPPGFDVGGVPLQEGRMMHQPALAATLEELARVGVEGFYSGALASRIADGLALEGSSLTAEDLAAHETLLAAPLEARFRQRTVMTTPPRSQGSLALQMLATLDRLDGAIAFDGGDAPTIAGIFRRVSDQRDVLATAGREQLDAAAFEARAEALLDDAVDRATGGLPDTRSDTIAIVTADDTGRRVVLIQSLFHYFGSRVFDPRLGILYQNRGAYGSHDPKSPARFEGGLRPVHTLMPMMVSDGERVTHLCGTMGGTAQPQILSQLILRMLQSPAMPLEEVIGAPRWFVGGVELGDPAGVVRLEPGLEEAAAALAASGYRIDVLGARSEALGHSQLIRIDPSGRFEVASDPRADGAGIVL